MIFNVCACSVDIAILTAWLGGGWYTNCVDVIYDCIGVL